VIRILPGRPAIHHQRTEGSGVNPATVMPPNEVVAEQHDSAALPKFERDRLVVTSRVVDGHVIVVSRYGDTRWSTSVSEAP